MTIWEYISEILRMGEIWDLISAHKATSYERKERLEDRFIEILQLGSGAYLRSYSGLQRACVVEEEGRHY